MNVLPILFPVVCIALTGASAFAGVGVWTKTGGPPGGSAQGFVADSASPGMVYSGSPNGLFKSSDYATSWTPICTTDPNPRPLAARSGTLYSTTPGATDPPGLVTKLYKSTDGGASCSVITEVSNQSNVMTTFDLIIDPFIPTALYRKQLSFVFRVGSPIGSTTLARSSDAGATWTDIGDGLDLGQNFVTVLASDPRTPDTLYAATLGFIAGVGTPTLFRSSNAGTTWTVVSTLPSAATQIAVDPFAPSTLYASLQGTGVKSVDGGATFHALNTDPIYQIVLDPAHRDRLYATTSYTVIVSPDGGSTWSPLGTGLPSSGFLALDSSASTLYAATSVGVFVYQDPGVLALNAAHPFSITLSATDQRTRRTGPGIATKDERPVGLLQRPSHHREPKQPGGFRQDARRHAR